ncbi:MAG: disulfide bond formation protein DsbA [Actinobacteria bacterium]|nr:disulfide bond formation protein DsbA [Actinomycetota bacterium]
MTVLEVYADIGCPFAYVGLRRLVARRDELGRPDVQLRVHAWPLELVNGEPLDPPSIAEEVEVLRDTVAPDLFTGFDESAFPASSLPAFDLVQSAYDIDVATGERVSLAVRIALFEDGRDVADPAVLAELAAAHGVTNAGEGVRAAVLGDWERGRAAGVRGSPEFFVAGEAYFCPVLEIERVDGELHVRVDETSMPRFLAACFAP